MDPSDKNSTPPGLFARLKQHHLYGVVVAYALVAGFLIQLLSRVLPAFGWGRAFPVVIIILAAGFPVAVVLAWTLIKPKDPSKYTSWQKLHWKLGATLSVVVVLAAVISGYFAWHLSLRHEARLAAAQAAAQPVAPAFNPPADRLVVLPFKNLSGDPKQQYFSDGITEELTGALGQTGPALQLLESSCPATPVGCNDLAVSPMYMALHGDPRFQKLAKQYTTATLDAPASAGSGS